MSMLSRRQALMQMGNGFGMLAASSLLADAVPTAGALAPRAPHFPPKAKRLLFLYLNGGPSHVDTFDPKPMLSKYDAQQVPDAFKQPDANAPLLGSPFTFKNYGRSGLPVSDLFPKLATLIDDFCVIRSMYTDNPGHEIGMLRMNCGHLTAGHPSMGSWITYGLGSENQNLPGFVVLCPRLPVMGAPLSSSAYLPC